MEKLPNLGDKIVVVESTDDSLLLKESTSTILSKKPYKIKELENAPKVRLHYFDEEDLQKLQQVVRILRSESKNARVSVFETSFVAIKNFLMK